MAEENKPSEHQQNADQAAAPIPTPPDVAAPEVAGGRSAAAGGQQQHRGGRAPSGQGRGGRPGGGRPGGRGRERERDESGVESAVVRIYRCSQVVKGGRTFSFGALGIARDR